MKLASLLLAGALLMGVSGPAFCESNPIAGGVEKITHAPMRMVADGNESLFTPVKDVQRPILGFADSARAAVVSVGLNLGHSVDE